MGSLLKVTGDLDGQIRKTDGLIRKVIGLLKMVRGNPESHIETIVGSLKSGIDSTESINWMILRSLG